MRTKEETNNNQNETTTRSFPGVLSSVASSTLFGGVGFFAAPVVGVVGSASLGTTLAVCSVGALILAVPYALLGFVINAGSRLATASNNLVAAALLWTLDVALHVGFVIGSAMVGAAVFGLVANPFVASALVGMAATTAVACAFAVVGLCAIGVFLTHEANAISTEKNDLGSTFSM